MKVSGHGSRCVLQPDSIAPCLVSASASDESVPLFTRKAVAVLEKDPILFAKVSVQFINNGCPEESLHDLVRCDVIEIVSRPRMLGVHGPLRTRVAMRASAVAGNQGLNLAKTVAVCIKPCEVKAADVERQAVVTPSIACL
jgi:hypothetical protein